VTGTITVVIPAYQRADKLDSRVKEILDWSNLKQLVISVDGLRLSATKSEAAQHLKTKTRSLELQRQNSQIVAIIWNENHGINQHVGRIFKFFSHEPGLIMIEEDVSVTHRTLDFLNTSYDKSGASAASAHVPRHHPGLDTQFFRKSFFPSQWGIAISNEIINRYLESLALGNFDKRLIRNAFKHSLGDFLSRYQLEKLTQWWFNHFFFCRTHGNWADALIQYSVYANDSHYNVPNESLIVDDAGIGDSRSLNPRITLLQSDFCNNEISTTPDGSYGCVRCEIIDCRIEDIRLEKLVRSTRYRLMNSKFRHKQNLEIGSFTAPSS